jgi:hypothetical protein
MEIDLTNIKQEIRPPYLIQRGKISNDGRLKLDYMGAAEFEFWALWNCMILMYTKKTMSLLTVSKMSDLLPELKRSASYDDLMIMHSFDEDGKKTLGAEYYNIICGLRKTKCFTDFAQYDKNKNLSSSNLWVDLDNKTVIFQNKWWHKIDEILFNGLEEDSEYFMRVELVKDGNFYLKFKTLGLVLENLKNNNLENSFFRVMVGRQQLMKFKVDDIIKADCLNDKYLQEIKQKSLQAFKQQLENKI